jgi:hypothetical protein
MRQQLAWFKADWLAILLTILSAAGSGEYRDASRHLVLNAGGADELGVESGDFPEIDSLRVPMRGRTWVSQLREEVGGASSEPVRFYAAGKGQSIALIPSRSFEGEDPHVLTAIGPNGEPVRRVVIHSFGAIDVYCPGRGRTDSVSSSRDSMDGCRYFSPPRRGPREPIEAPDATRR